VIIQESAKPAKADLLELQIAQQLVLLFAQQTVTLMETVYHALLELGELPAKTNVLRTAQLAINRGLALLAQLTSTVHRLLLALLSLQIVLLAQQLVFVLLALLDFLELEPHHVLLAQRTALLESAVIPSMEVVLLALLVFLELIVIQLALLDALLVIKKEFALFARMGTLEHLACLKIILLELFGVL